MSTNNTALESVALRAQAEQIADHYLSHQPPGGAFKALGDPDRIQRLLASIRDGNYREVAIKQAGIARQTFYNWLKRAEAGEQGAIQLVDALEKAEADAEADIVRNVRNASKLPQYWAAGATHLERKYPERWGRRQDDASTPKVVVQIGVNAQDVQITTFASQASTLSEDTHSLSGDVESVNSGYVNQPQVLEIGPSGAGTDGGPQPVGRASDGGRGGSKERRVGGVRKKKADV